MPAGADSTTFVELGQLPPHPVQGVPTHAVLEPRQGRLPRQTLAGDRIPPQQQLADGILGQMVGIAPVRMAARAAEYLLTDQVLVCAGSSPARACRPDTGRTPG